jgi:hypothetical protein
VGGQIAADKASEVLQSPALQTGNQKMTGCSDTLHGRKRTFTQLENVRRCDASWAERRCGIQVAYFEKPLYLKGFWRLVYEQFTKYHQVEVTN